jgi:hypothetical protein
MTNLYGPLASNAALVTFPLPGEALLIQAVDKTGGHMHFPYGWAVVGP